MKFHNQTDIVNTAVRDQKCHVNQPEIPSNEGGGRLTSQLLSSYSNLDLRVLSFSALAPIQLVEFQADLSGGN